MGEGCALFSPGARTPRASETHTPSPTISFREKEKHILCETAVTAHSGKMDGVLTPASWAPARRAAAGRASTLLLQRAGPAVPSGFHTFFRVTAPQDTQEQGT